MRRVTSLAFAALAVAGLPFSAQAKGGGPLHLYLPISTPAEAGTLTEIHGSRPARSEPLNDSLAGCGRGRYRDPMTHRCRGPAEIIR